MVAETVAGVTAVEREVAREAVIEAATVAVVTV